MRGHKAVAALFVLAGACGRLGFGGGATGGADGPAADGAADATFTVGGTVTGLSSSGLELQNNGGDTLAVAGDGPFTFATELATGATYQVTILTQPGGQTCSVANGSGTFAARDVTNVVVTCSSIARVQTGPVLEGTGSLPVGLTATTAGNLLVVTAAMDGCSLGANYGSTWKGAVQAINAPNCAVCWSIIYYGISPGGAQTVTLTGDATATMIGQITEWSGLAIGALDQIGSATASSGKTLPVATAAATGQPGELAITAFCVAASSALTVVPETGWTNLGNTGASAASIHHTSDFQAGLAVGTITETQTSSQQAKWSGVIATFR